MCTLSSLNKEGKEGHRKEGKGRRQEKGYEGKDKAGNTHFMMPAKSTAQWACHGPPDCRTFGTCQGLSNCPEPQSVQEKHPAWQPQK